MSFTPIQTSDFHNRCVSELADQPTLSATALKQRFDAPAREVVAPAVNRLIGELEDATSAASLGVVAPINRTGTTVQGVVNSISSDLDDAILDVANLQVEAHSHPNKEVIDNLTDSDGELLYGGNPIGQTDYNNLDNLPSINGHTVAGNQSAADLGIVIPDELADLSDDTDHRLVSDAEKTAWNAKSTVSVTQIKSAGEKIADITIDGVKTDIYASAGGGGGGGAVDSVNGQTGDVVLDASDVGALPDSTVIPDPQIQSDWNQADNTAKDYIKNKPTIPDAQIQSNWTQADTTAKDYIKNKPTVDQSYNASTSPLSPNAQSGIAVDAAINAKMIKTFSIENVSSTSSIQTPADPFIKADSIILPPCCDKTGIMWTTITVNVSGGLGTVTVGLTPDSWNGAANFEILVLNK